MSEIDGLYALVVEDEPAWRQIITEILMECSFDVDVAYDVEGAARLVQQRSHRLAVVDLALGDGQATNQDGLHVLEILRRRDPGCATILLTGYATVELAVRVLNEYGALSCLRKASFDRSAFQHLAKQALLAPPIFETPGSRVPSALHRAAEVIPAIAVGSLLGPVLIVEDDAGWRSILAELLEDVGYRIRLCNSYGEAVGCLRREQYTIAVVDLSLCDAVGVCDATRPMDGYQLLSMAQRQGVPTIVVSGMADPSDIECAYEYYGVHAYLEKQVFDRRAFLQAVMEAQEAGKAAQELSTLTAREAEVLAFLTQGMTNKEIADALVISTNTVKHHLTSIFDKLEVHTRAAAVAKATTVGRSAELNSP